MPRWSPLGLVLFLAAPLAAQNPPPRHVLHGVVFDSVAQAPLAGAVVQIAPRGSTGPLYSATTDSSGHFRIADLPAGQFLIGFYHDALTALGLDAPLRTFELAADTNVTIDLGIPSGAVMPALARDVPVQNGTFFLSELPVGTWVVEARAIGLEPRSVWVEATEGGTAETTITMSDRAQPLDAVTVIGEPSHDSKILEDVLRRQRSSFGTVFLPGDPWLRGALHTADVLRAARGFRYVSPTDVSGRLGCRGAINIYVNGEFFPGGLEELDAVAPVRDVLAVEAYPDVAFAPIQWRMNRGMTINRDGTVTNVCAVVVVWTSR